ncbi:MAG: radical SAM protein [Clostridium argentinense]|uniref:Radical SAM protein n=1 Tax=Clostridium faecium TaxID=2762223 RepID=A0ABR8YVN2_9CLOT|nr:radical SAM protein [Clostridium faecium]MBD8048270.1 radical SAM protein [Clostridium faecium]MBS5824684.1 radical SAM protein [Clostridium argentinense]MDU1350866.1 radical SAM protein [Clostridium argentinense]
MNKIVLCTVAPVSQRTAEENLGIGYLAETLRKNNYIVSIIDAWLTPLTDDKIIELLHNEMPFFALGFSCYMTNIPRTISLMKRIKKLYPDVFYMCGGFGPTFNSEEFISAGFNIAMRGEGEATIVEVCNYLTTGEPTLNNILGITYLDSSGKILGTNSRPLINDLDSLPMPSRETMRMAMKRKSYVNICTSRGCHGNCMFCSVIAFFRKSPGKHWRGRSVTSIVDEIELLYKGGVRYIKAVDDSFIDGDRDADWCRKLADELERRGINVILRSAMRADKVTDEILYHLKRAGFISFSVGIENGSPSALKRMNKLASLDINIKALQLFKKHGLYMQAGFILFDIDTTYQELFENYQFLKKYDWMITKGIFSEMFAAEGTAYTNKLAKNNNLKYGNTIFDNSHYEIKDIAVRKVHFGFKIWHKSHIVLYDMAVEPLTSPKTIDMKYFEKFYDLQYRLKNYDIDFFGDLLILIESKKEYGYEEIENYVTERIQNMRSVYHELMQEVQKLYEDCNLIYDADKNPFFE